MLDFAGTEKCNKCKWNNLFWEKSGCAKRNAMEPCEFEEKKQPAKEVQDNG